MLDGHSFASIANDLGFTEVTITALVGHQSGLSDEGHCEGMPIRKAA